MRKLIVLMAALFLVSGISLAQEDMQDQQMDQQAEEQTMTATIEAVDAEQKLITVTGPEGEMMELMLSDETLITGPEGEMMEVGDLSAGKMVEITYTGTMENPTVTGVTVIQKTEKQY